MSTSEFLTPAECAARLNVTSRTLEEWRRLQRGPGYHRIGRRVQYARADIDKWIDAQRVRGSIDVGHWLSGALTDAPEVLVQGNEEALAAIAAANASGTITVIKDPDGNTIVWAPTVGSIWIEPGANVATIRIAPIDGPFVELRREQLRAAVERYVTATKGKG